MTDLSVVQNTITFLGAGKYKLLDTVTHVYS